MDAGKFLSVNKVGGSSVSQMKDVMDLVEARKNQGESPVLVVSAFKGVTDELVDALSVLNETEYTREDIQAALSKAKKIVFDKIYEYIHTQEYQQQALDHVEATLEVAIQALLTHKNVSKVLEPINDSDITNEVYTVRDKVIAFGEQSVVGVLEAYLEEQGIKAKAIKDVSFKPEDGSDISKLSKRELQAGVQRGIAESLEPHKESISDTVLIIGGHVSNVRRGMVREIGRSYTDTTAADTTVALKSLGLEVNNTIYWKEVDGLLSADPRQLENSSNPVLHRKVSLKEAIEAAAAGSQLMQIDALKIALQHDLTLSIGNINNPNEIGTTFVPEEVKTDHPFKIVMSNSAVDIIHIKSSDKAALPGFFKVFGEILKKHDLSAHDSMTSGTSTDYTIVLPKDKADKVELRSRIKKAVEDMARVTVNNEVYEMDIEIDQGVSNLVVIGDELANKGSVACIMAVLAAEGIQSEGIVQNTDLHRLSLYVPEKDALKGVRSLHRFFIDKDLDYRSRITDQVTANLLAS